MFKERINLENVLGWEGDFSRDVLEVIFVLFLGVWSFFFWIYFRGLVCVIVEYSIRDDRVIVYVRGGKYYCIRRIRFEEVYFFCYLVKEMLFIWIKNG